MIARAFEHPNFDRLVSFGICNMDWIMNDIRHQEKVIENTWRSHQTFNPEEVDKLFGCTQSLADEYRDLKAAILKTYLTDIEAQKLTEREKMAKETDRRIRLIKLNDRLNGR